MLRLILYGVGFVLFFFLNVCTTPPAPPRSTAIPQPMVTLTSTRGALMTLTPSKQNMNLPLAATITPDPNVISEVYMAPHDVLSFRYPPTWSITDQSNESEILVKAESLPNAGIESIFVVNLLNAAEELRSDGLEALADTYLRHLLESEFNTMDISYRQVGDTLIATAIRLNLHPMQFEVRFSVRGAFYQVLTLIASPDEWQQARLVLDGMARSVIVNKEMAAFIPTPPASAVRQDEGLAVQNVSLYTAKTGALFIVGEVLNHSQQPYEDVQVTLSLLDDNKVQLIRQPWAIERNLLPANRRSPFVAVINQPPDNWSTFELVADALPANFYSQRLSDEFEILDLTTFDSPSSAYGLMGRLTNIGKNTHSVKLISALYNEEGNVIAVSRITLGSHTIRTGEEPPIELVFYTKADGKAANYKIWVEGTLIGE